MLYCSVTVRPYNMLNVRHMIVVFKKQKKSAEGSDWVYVDNFII